MQEVEAKYLVCRPDKGRVKGLMTALEAAAFKIKPISTVRHVDTYFDTAESHLSRAGWSYRLRSHTKNDASSHTLKRLVPGTNGLFHRAEITQIGTSAGALPYGPVSTQLNQLLPSGATVQPLFQQSTRRRNIRIKHPEFPKSRAMISVDRVSISGAAFDYCELEVELARGDPLFITAITSVIGAMKCFVVARMCKYDRAKFLLGISHRSTSDMDLSETKNWQQLGIGYLTAQMNDIEHYEPFAWEGVHPEGVHRMRVATRHMRSGLKWWGNALSETRVAVVRKDLKGLTRTLGAIRDLDVHIASLARPSGRYADRVSKEHLVARREFVNLITNGHMRRLREDYETLLADLQPCEISIAEALRTRVVPALTATTSLGAHVRIRDPKSLHELRLAIKDLNCVLESVPTLLPAIAAAVTDLKDVLGEYQDAQVAIERVSGERGKAMARLCSRYEKRAEKALQRLRKPWRRFMRAVDDLHRPPS